MDGGRSIPISELQPADIIVSTTAATSSRVIRIGTRSSVSHARLYVGNGEVIEAVADGVVQVRLETAMNDDILTIAFRRQGMTAAAADGIIRFAQRQIGKPYDYGGAAAAAPKGTVGIVCSVNPALCGALAGGRASNIINADAQFFCSELVSRAFDANNLRIVDMAAYRANPNDVYTSHYLDYVGHLKGG